MKKVCIFIRNEIAVCIVKHFQECYIFIEILAYCGGVIWQFTSYLKFRESGVVVFLNNISI